MVAIRTCFVVALASLLALCAAMRAETSTVNVVEDWPGFRARHYRLTRTVPGIVPIAAQTAEVSGTRRVLVVNASFPGVAPLISNVQAQDYFFNRTAAYYDGSSYGQIALTGEVRAYELPTQTCSFAGLFDQAVAAADPDVDFTQVEHIVFYAAIPGCGWSGVSTVGAWTHATAEGTRWLSFSVIRTVTYTETVTYHEFGHAIGLTHAQAIICPASLLPPGCREQCEIMEYGDEWDVMGLYYAGHSLNARHRDWSGWMGGGRIAEVVESGTWTIGPLDARDSALKAIRVRRGYADATYAEFRPGIGVLLHVMNSDAWNDDLDSSKFPSSLIPRTSTAAGTTYVFPPGAAWTDPGNGTRITNLGQTATSATLSVAYVTPDITNPTGLTVGGFTPGGTVSGIVPLTVAATDERGWLDASFWLVQDGYYLFYPEPQDFTEPLGYEWDTRIARYPTTTTHDGLASIRFKVCDASGNFAQSVTYSVYISNGSATPVPTATRTPTVAVPTRTPTAVFTPTRTPTKCRWGNSWKCR